ILANPEVHAPRTDILGLPAAQAGDGRGLAERREMRGRPAYRSLNRALDAEAEAPQRLAVRYGVAVDAAQLEAETAHAIVDVGLFAARAPSVEIHHASFGNVGAANFCEKFIGEQPALARPIRRVRHEGGAIDDRSGCLSARRRHQSTGSIRAMMRCGRSG